MSELRLESLPRAIEYRMTRWHDIDLWLLGLLVGLSLFGWLMVTSASIDTLTQNSGNGLSMMRRHGFFLGLGVVAWVCVMLVSVQLWYRFSALLLLLATLGLFAVWAPGIGVTVNGATRWLEFQVFRVQPSEVVKLALVVYLAAYLQRRQDEVRSSWKGFMKPILMTSGFAVVLLAQPDFGALVIIMMTMMVMMFLGGVRLGQFVLALTTVTVLASVLALTQAYRVQRLLTFMDPWSSENVFNSGYQLTQALIAFGRGEWFGVGLGNSLQKLFYLPEAHTDFITAVIAEEFGLLGLTLMLLAYAVLIGRILWVGWHAEHRGELFAGYVCYGIAMIFSLQVFINVGVNAGLLPTKGLTLPLISYGGSSLVVNIVMVALVTRIALALRTGEFDVQNREMTS
jgi:cell division protein FtsW